MNGLADVARVLETGAGEVQVDSALGLRLVTHNTRHFERVPGLKIEDWMT